MHSLGTGLHQISYSTARLSVRFKAVLSVFERGYLFRASCLTNVKGLHVVSSFLPTRLPSFAKMYDGMCRNPRPTNAAKGVSIAATWAPRTDSLTARYNAGSRSTAVPLAVSVSNVPYSYVGEYRFFLSGASPYSFCNHNGWILSNQLSLSVISEAGNFVVLSPSPYSRISKPNIHKRPIQRYWVECPGRYLFNQCGMLYHGLGRQIEGL